MVKMVWWPHVGRQDFVRESFKEDIIFDLSLYKELGFATWKKKKREKRRAEDEKPVRKEFGRSDFLIKDIKDFWANFFICISDRKSLTLSLQWNSVWCWWNDNWAITKIHECYPWKALIKSVVSHRFMSL